MIRVRLSSAAERDVLEAQKWYAAKAPGLDLTFRDDLDRVLLQIREFPRGFPVVYENIRRANLHGFPYGVFYAERRTDLFVLGVVHHARHPSRWKRRV